MPQETWQYEDNDVSIYTTDGYTDSDGAAGTDADVDDTERFTGDIDLTSYQGASVDIKYNPSGNTDDLDVSLYHRRDSSWEGTEDALTTITITNAAGAERVYHIDISPSNGPGHFRIGLLASGNTDTFEIDARLRYYRKNR